ncbi:MAG: methionyl-tRNA formyltransferase [Acidobacteriota bacterium]
MRTLFFGTPEFAVPTLAAMVESGFAPERVITQPARPAGRGHGLRQPPVAAWALEHGLTVMQPEKVNRRAFRAELREVAPDVAIVVAFGQIFKRRLLDLPRLGCVNLHASLLPQYRGAAPIQAAIAAGDSATGVTTMMMTQGLDSGPILLQAELPIGPQETTPELSRRLAERGASLMTATLRALEGGELTALQQNEDLVSYAPQLSKADGMIDWRRTAGETYNRLRAYTPWPGQTGELRGKRVKVLWCRPLSGASDEEPGTLLGLREGCLAVACGEGTLLGLERFQLPGKKPVSAADFANGARLTAGLRFEVEAV